MLRKIVSKVLCSHTIIILSFFFQPQETMTVSTPAPPPNPEDASNDEYGKGVVFYLKDKKVAGVLLWNVFKKLPLARQVDGDDLLILCLVEITVSGCMIIFRWICTYIGHIYRSSV